MRARRRLGPFAALLGASALAGCVSGASVVENKDGRVVLRWDESRTPRSQVVSQAIDLCGGWGQQARRAMPVADTADGPVHTTVFRCAPIQTGG
jgi:hypothetical protein